MSVLSPLGGLVKAFLSMIGYYPVHRNAREVDLEEGEGLQCWVCHVKTQNAEDTCFELRKNLNISVYANNVQDCRCSLEMYISTFVCIWCISVVSFCLNILGFSDEKQALVFLSGNWILSFFLKY